jgi:hypothetical protein
LDPSEEDPGVGINPPRTLLFELFPVPFFFNALFRFVYESSPTDLE